MKNIIAIAAIALAARSGVSYAQAAATAAQPAPTTQEKSAPLAVTAPVSDGLSDLDKITFGCPRAGLNAAAREAAKVRSQGTYQFSFFRIVSDTHHASYEVHFKSNYQGEPDLKYCVALYCQQGWDPKTTKATVSVIGSDRHAAGGATHGACSATPPPVKGRVKR